MPGLRSVLVRRVGPLGVALTVYDIWRHLPKKQRQQLLEHGRTHGTRAARFLLKEGSAQLKKHRG